MSTLTKSMGLKSAYRDICRGYTTDIWDDKTVYIKHLNQHDQIGLDDFYEQARFDAEKRGIRTEKVQLDWLIKKGLWAAKDDIEMAQQKDYIENMEKTRSKLIARIQIDKLTKDINAAKEKINKDLTRKSSLLGITAEKIAEQKMQYEYIRLSFFRDAEMNKLCFSSKDVHNMDDKESYGLMDLYLRVITKFNQDALRHMAVSSFFTGYLYLCGDNMAAFFNRPICDLTLYQLNLLSYGMYFKNILSQNQVPDDVREDPDKVEEYVRIGQNRDELLQRMGSGHVGIVASAADLKAMNLRDDTSTVVELAQKGYSDARKAARDGVF